MSWLPHVLHFVVMLLGPIYLVGVVNRVKSRWAGRAGPALHQSAFDLLRLLRKGTVYSNVGSGLVPAGPIVLLGSTLVAGAITPLVSGHAPMCFDHDFVVFAYLLGLGRLFMVLSAMDTGSAFEGMGASREAQYAVLIEPAFFLALGALALSTGETSFARILGTIDLGPMGLAVRAAAVVVAVLMLQVEAARAPVDDPTTHLELTMIHEVMVLDHSGPDLAFVQYAAALKLTLCAGIVASLLNPLSAMTHPLGASACSLALLAGVAVFVGLVESLMARLRLSAVPLYLLIATLAGLLALAAAA